MANQPKFAVAPRIGVGVLDTQNTDPTGTSGAVVKVFDAGPNGSRIEMVELTLLKNTKSTNSVSFFVGDASTKVRRWTQPLGDFSGAGTGADAATIPVLFGDYHPFILGAGQSIYATLFTVRVGWDEVVNVFVMGGDF